MLRKHFHNNILVAVSSFLLLTVFLILSIGHVHAAEIDNTCGEGQLKNFATGQLPKNEYDIYVKFGRPTDIAQATIYAHPQELNEYLHPDACKVIGRGIVSGTSWAKLGSIKLDQPVNSGVIVLASNVLQGGFDAGAPTVVFVAHDNNICEFVTGCVVDYQGQKMRLSPQKISISSDILKLGLLRSIKDEAVKQVVYSVDDRPAYTSDKLSAFNLNYVSGGEHIIQRTVIFESGQTLIDTSTVQRGASYDLKYAVIAFIYHRLYTISLLGAIFVAVLAIFIALMVARHIHQNHAWRMTHILSRDFKQALGAGPQTDIKKETSLQFLWRIRNYIISLMVFMFAVFMVNAYVITLFTVDGVSMFPTLKDRDQKYLYKAPKLVAKINKGIYLPQRGDIVVIQNVENSLFTDNTTKSESYVVKRVIGLPGERVTVKDGIIKVYNDQYQDGFEPDTTFNWIKDLPDSKDYLLDITLKAGELFVSGDNRQMSFDSRSYGPVNAEQVVGKVF